MATVTLLHATVEPGPGGDQLPPAATADPVDLLAGVLAATGAELHHAGADQVLALFPSALEAASVAMRLQQSFAASERAAALRIGIDVAELSNPGMTARAIELELATADVRALGRLAEPGQIVLSSTARSVLRLQAELPIVAHDAAASPGLGRLEWATSQPPVRVVVAEDSVLVRAGLVRLLGEEGFAVVGEAADHDELLAVGRRLRPKLVVTDVRMPPTQTTEGIAAAATLRAEDPDVAVLVVSQHVEPAAAALLLEHNPSAVGYLLKERVSHIDQFIDACRTVAAGGVVIDELVTEQFLRQARRTDVVAALSERERNVIDLMAQGKSNAAIARQLHLAPKTLETHIRAIFTKLGLHEHPDDHRRVAAVVQWLRSHP